MNLVATRPDVVFVSYEEPNADENYARVLKFAPQAKRVHHVAGVFNAWRQAADLSSTSHFFLVEGDNWILDDFSLEAPPPALLADICLWRARNAVNGLVWYNGGLKLLSVASVFTMERAAVDFFASMRGSRKVFDQVATETRFNATPFLAWRCGFRECAKLEGGVVSHPDVGEMSRTWQTLGSNTPNGAWCILGSKMGAAFGKKHRDTETLRLINNMDWLNAEFEKLPPLD